VVLTPGQRHDSTQLEPVLDAIRVPRPGGRGRPRKRPDHLVGDKAYSYPTCRRLLRRRGIGHTIPQRSDQRARRARRPGRPLAFDRERYRGRNVVERCFNRLKQFRAVATRFEKRAVNYRAVVVIASLLIWLKGDHRARHALARRWRRGIRPDRAWPLLGTVAGNALASQTNCLRTLGCGQPDRGRSSDWPIPCQTSLR